MKKILMIVSIAVAAFQTVHAGDVTGKVTLKGTPPPEKEITDIKNSADCGKMHTAPVKTRFYVVGAENGLGDVVVSIKGAPSSSGASAQPAVLDQKGCEYIPYVTAIQVDQKLSVKNSDPVLHNVHSTPNVAGNKEENKAQMPKGPDLTFSFAKPESFLRFKCDVHPWMFSYVSVFDHPYFAVTDKDGNFTIKNVPPGKYTLEFAHRKAGTASQEIEVKDQPVTASATLEVK